MSCRWPCQGQSQGQRKLKVSWRRHRKGCQGELKSWKLKSGEQKCQVQVEDFIQLIYNSIRSIQFVHYNIDSWEAIYTCWDLILCWHLFPRSKNQTLENQTKQIVQLKNYIGESETIPRPVEIWRKEKETLENRLKVWLGNCYK